MNVATNVEMANGYVYTNAIIKRVLPDSILVDSDVFAGSIPCENLAPKFQKYFDKQKIDEFRLNQQIEAIRRQLSQKYSYKMIGGSLMPWEQNDLNREFENAIKPLKEAYEKAHPTPTPTPIPTPTPPQKLFKKIKIISLPPGARIEVNDDYIGDAPISVEVEVNGPESGEFEGYCKKSVFIRAMPILDGQETQHKIIIDKPPNRILFDMSLVRAPSQVDVNLKNDN